MPTPQLDSIAQLTPMARAPPAGSVLATELEPRFTTAACRSRIDGSTEQIMNHTLIMLTAAVPATSATCGQAMARRLAQTL